MYEAKWYVQLVRFITLSLIHFQFANEYGLAVKCMKYIALHEKRFKYPFRAFLSSSISILSVIAVESLSVKYIMCHDTVLDVVNNFIKMKILASFDDFFVEPFKQSSLNVYLAKEVEFEMYRKEKIIINKSKIRELTESVVNEEAKIKPAPEVIVGMKELAEQIQ